MAGAIAAAAAPLAPALIISSGCDSLKSWKDLGPRFSITCATIPTRATKILPMLRSRCRPVT